MPAQCYEDDNSLLYKGNELLFAKEFNMSIVDLTLTINDIYLY